MARIGSQGGEHKVREEKQRKTKVGKEKRERMESGGLFNI